MLVSLSDIKSYLGVSANTYDSFLNEQGQIISDAIEGYCGRKFLSASYIQTFWSDDYDDYVKELQLFHYPVTALTYVKEIDTDSSTEENVTTEIRLHKPSGKILYVSGFFRSSNKVTVSYTAGLAAVPSPIKSVLYSLIEERYNKKISGVQLNFGSDVQSISIPGTISIAFDYSLQANERKTAFGTILGNYINVLDAYRSERRITGSGTVGYVD